MVWFIIMTGVDLRIAVTERGIEGIAHLHSLPLSTFEGMTVYDLGCGKSDLGADLARVGINATVIGFDENAEALAVTRGKANSTDKRFARLDKLPVDDESADIAIATYSLPLYGKTSDQIRGFFRECRRVVRTGGLLSIYPIATGLSGDRLDPKIPTRGEITESEASGIRRSSDWQTISRDYQTLTARKAK